ncbi:hypothetical protein [Halorientalis sp. IM1011]|uniref:hypothetical protein n=1 Tax=Halorientalis sp. IM1011 TaxID=1932360 RepID=UPI0012F8DFFB|nr:hypothetical protein [Halorientalis sp. IM1011]
MDQSDDRRYTAAKYVSRRTALRASGIAVATMLAGCSQSDAQETPDTTQSPDQGSDLIDDIRFDAQDLVVELTAGHDVSTVNLIAPDGTLYAEESVSSDVSTLHIKIIEVDPGLGRYQHYTPGEYELHLDHGNSSENVPIKLSPDIQISSIEQAQSKDRSNLGQIEVTVENTGTAPTWVHDISFSDSPNFAADGDIKENPGIIPFGSDSIEELIVPPKSTQTYTSPTAPLVFQETARSGCEGTSVEFTVKIGIATQDVISQQLIATPSGEQIRRSLSDEFTCTAAEIQQAGPSGGD